MVLNAELCLKVLQPHVKSRMIKSFFLLFKKLQIFFRCEANQKANKPLSLCNRPKPLFNSYFVWCRMFLKHIFPSFNFSYSLPVLPFCFKAKCWFAFLLGWLLHESRNPLTSDLCEFATLILRSLVNTFMEHECYIPLKLTVCAFPKVFLFQFYREIVRYSSESAFWGSS